MKRIVLNTLLFMGLAHLLPGVQVSNFWGALVSAIVFALLSVTVKPLMEFLAWPLNFITFGLANWMIAAFTLIMTTWLPGGLLISSFWMALFVAVVLSLAQNTLGLDT